MAVFRSKKTKKAKTKKNKLSLSLRLLNFAAFSLLLVQAALILLLSNSQSSSRPITTGYLVSDKAAGGAAGQSVTAQAQHLLFDLNLAYLVAAFLFVGAIYHLILATRYRAAYDRDIKNGTNKARWAELSVNLSLIMVAVALLTGVYELSSLLMIFALTAVFSLMGFMTERRISKNDKPVGRLAYLEGLKFGLVPWLVVIIYVWGAYAYGGVIPGFVYLVYIVVLLLFGGLLANMYMQARKMGHWEDFVFGEKIFIALVVLVKSALAWLIFAGTLS